MVKDRQQNQDWPAISFETYPWKMPQPMSNRARKRYSQPYEAAVTTKIAEQPVYGVSPEVASLAEEAAIEMAKFDALAGPKVGYFSAMLFRSEAASSSQIENLTATARAVALAEIGDDSRTNAALITANAAAMDEAVKHANGMSAASIIAVHRVLLERHNPDIVGRFRDQQVWIGGSNYGPHGAKFVPPHHSRVASSIDDLDRFAERTDVGAVTLIALAHAQFETIHPFPDGNGRTGRALAQTMLRDLGVTEHACVPISSGLVANPDRYFNALDAYRGGDINPIIENFAEASLVAVDNGKQLHADLESIKEAWSLRIKARRGSTALAVAEILMQQPAVSVPTLRTQLDVTDAAIYSALDRLADNGIIVEDSGWKRNRRWIAPEILDALDSFADRSTRRQRP